MRVSNLEQRAHLDRSRERELFQPELEYYRLNNQYPVRLFGRDIVNIYRNINVQVVITRACGYRCGFCIEADSEVQREIDPIPLFRETLRQYAEQGVRPAVSITGGEPTLYPARVREAITAGKEFGALRVSLNTNGHGLAPREQWDCMVNVSRHHYTPEKVFEVFQKPSSGDVAGCIVQCVLMGGFVDSLKEVKAFIEGYPTAKGFSFRGLTTLDGCKPYPKELSFTDAHWVDSWQIVNEVAADPEFQFIEQKIGDHYWFEIYRRKGKIVRFTYSNFAWLREVETQERQVGVWFSRATIVAPDGHVYAGWTYDINQIV